MDYQKRTLSAPTNNESTNFSGIFSLSFLLVLIFAQNPDIGNIGLLWWGSIAFFIFAFFYSSGKILFIDRKYTYWAVGFTAVCALSLFWAISSSLVITALKSMIVHLIVLLLLRSTIKNRKDIEHVLKLILASVSFNAVWLLITNKSMFNSTSSEDEIIDRLGTEGSWNANNVGMLAAIAMIFSLYFHKTAKTKSSKLLNLVISGFMIFIVLLSGSRKALITVVIEFCVFVFISSKGKRTRAVLLILGIIMGLYYAIMEIPFFHSIIGWRMEGFLASLTGVGEVDGSTEVRGAFVEDAIRAWREKPILGWGLDCYRRVNQIKSMYAHNNYVELLADLGIVGTAVYYSSYIYCLVQLTKNKQKDLLRWVMLILLFVTIFIDYGMVSYNSFLTKTLIMLMFAWISTERSNHLERK